MLTIVSKQSLLMATAQPARCFLGSPMSFQRIVFVLFLCFLGANKLSLGDAEVLME